MFKDNDDYMNVRVYFDKGYNKCSIYSDNESYVREMVKELNHNGYLCDYIENGFCEGQYVIKRKRKEKYIELLEQLIKYHNNDLAIDDRHNHKGVVNAMILELVSYIHNFHYCSNENCHCSPKSGIKNIYENNKEVFSNTRGALFPISYELFEEIVN